MYEFEKGIFLCYNGHEGGTFVSKKKSIFERDAENELADQWNEKLKLDKSGNAALILVCVFEFLLLLLFDYLFCIYIFHDEYDLVFAMIIATCITGVTGYFAYQRRKKKN